MTPLRATRDVQSPTDKAVFRAVSDIVLVAATVTVVATRTNVANRLTTTISRPL
jgi:hypothetical protein